MDRWMVRTCILEPAVGNVHVPTPLIKSQAKILYISIFSQIIIISFYLDVKKFFIAFFSHFKHNAVTLPNLHHTPNSVVFNTIFLEVCDIWQS